MGTKKNRDIIFTGVIVIITIAGFIYGLIVPSVSDKKAEIINQNFKENSKIYRLSDDSFLARDTIASVMYYIECNNLLNSDITTIKLLK